MENYRTNQAYETQNTDCEVRNITPLSTNTFQVMLKVLNNKVVSYHAGQYIQLELDVLGTGQKQVLSYSIANRAKNNEAQEIQLFIQNVGEFSQKVLKRLTELRDSRNTVKVLFPKGKAFLQTDLTLKHLLIAAGSGIAKIKCIAEEALSRNPLADIALYWSNKKLEDFYLLHELQSLSKTHPNFRFTSILESEHADWTGRTGYIYRVIEEDLQSLEGIQTYLCGSPLMVYGTLDQLRSCGLTEQQCYSDVFEYAPRQ